MVNRYISSLAGDRMYLIPKSFVKLCQAWHSGSYCEMYTIATTGRLDYGTIRPRDCDTIQKCVVQVWRGLCDDIKNAMTNSNIINAEREALDNFLSWVQFKLQTLEQTYNLTKWGSK